MSKVALVTCGSRGIGRAISAALAGAGYSVIVNYETEMLAELAHDSIARSAHRPVSHRPLRPPGGGGGGGALSGRGRPGLSHRRVDRCAGRPALTGRSPPGPWLASGFEAGLTPAERQC